MSMRWVRLDTSFPTNPKVLELLSEPNGYRAAFVYVCGLAWIGAQGTDGHIPKAALKHIHARPRDADLLVKAELWRVNMQGWWVRDWAEYQPTSESERRRSEIARDAALSRWRKGGAGDA